VVLLRGLDSMIPPFLTHPDPDGLSFDEREALKPRRAKWAVRPAADAWHFGIEVQRLDGAKVVRPVPLNSARFERLCREIDAGVHHRGWSLSPEQP
jgi:hypothetical protein